MNDNKTTVSNADNKQGISDAPNGKKKPARFNRQVDIHIHSRRNRLADYDGLFSKYAIDSLVSLGILQDDRPEKVRKITHTQEKTDKLEETIITITTVERDSPATR